MTAEGGGDHLDLLRWRVGDSRILMVMHCTIVDRLVHDSLYYHTGRYYSVHMSVVRH